MLYWRDIFCKAVKYATRTLRIDSARGIGTIILTQVVVGGLLFLGTSFAGAGLPTRVASAFAPFILFPIYVLLFLPTVITEEDAAKVEEIASLNRRVAELEAEGQSDIAIHLNLNYVVWTHVDWRNVVHQYRVVIENVGPNHLTNCVLRLSTANQFNFALHDRTCLKDASAVFELRRGQVETLGILWVDAYDETQPARPNYHMPQEEMTDPMAREGEIIPADQTYFLFAEVLSANTPPARLTMKVWNDGQTWQIEALRPGEKPSF